MFSTKNSLTFVLYFCNIFISRQTEKDILVREELQELQEDNQDRFKLFYTLDRPEEGMQRRCEKKI